MTDTDTDSTARANEAHKHTQMLCEPQTLTVCNAVWHYTHTAYMQSRLHGNTLLSQALDIHLRTDTIQHDTGKFKAGV
jgi:hypothetical protein